MNKREFTPEEIAKSLRTCCTPKPDRGFIPRIDCESCGFKRSPATCRWNLQRTAADMIEAQAKRIGELEAELVKLREENRWIPVEERLPDRELDEIAKAVNTELHYPGFQCLAMIQGAKYPTILNYADIDGDRVWVDDECDWYPVTHWKPMPKGPEVGHE